MAFTDLKPHIACERLIKVLRSEGITDEKVLETFRKVPRHLFVDGALVSQAYEDTTLLIGQNQTISQPSIVALMTQLLAPRKNDKILEIGTGSGFQTAILAQFSLRVYTVERHRELGDAARLRLRKMGYENVVFKVGDGSGGWPQYGPYDRIIVTAGAPVIPKSLLDQLAAGGRLVIPVGDKKRQSLELYEKQADGIRKSSIDGVVFVPLIGNEGWEE